MPINTLEYAKIFQTQLDKQVVAEATSGWMEANAGQVKYNGGNEIKVPKVSLQGLGDYDRDNGFAQGSVSYGYQTLTMGQDRGRTFQLDAMDVDETNFVNAAGTVMGEFQRTKVVPEIDAYRYSKIATGAIAKGKVTAGYTPSASDILTKLKSDIEKVLDIAGDGVQLVITMAIPTATVLENTSEIAKKLDVMDFSSGAFNTKVKSLDGDPIVKVPSGRMKTAYTFYDGTTSGQEGGGFVAAAGAKNINWIICARRCPIAISKTDVIRIFDPQQNQKANAWKIDYRKYHELFIMDNAWDLVWVNIKEALA